MADAGTTSLSKPMNSNGRWLRRVGQLWPGQLLANTSHEIRHAAGVIGTTETAAGKTGLPAHNSDCRRLLGSAEGLMSFASAATCQLDLARADRWRRAPLATQGGGSEAKSWNRWPTVSSLFGRANRRFATATGGCRSARFASKGQGLTPCACGRFCLNRLHNAIKSHLEVGGVRIVLRSGGAPGQVRFSVIDTGIGIRPAKIASAHPFEPFVQVDASSSR